jgi:hypothetical protein
MLDLRADSAQLVSGHRAREGIRLNQNGEWDDRILCDKHERAIGSADNYGVKFCRNWRTAQRQVVPGKALEVSNSRPDALLRFGYAVIWRQAVSEEGRKSGPKLRQYEHILLDSLLQEGPYDLELLVGVNPLMMRDRPVDFCIPPYRDRMGRYNVIHFTLSGLDFYLKVDQRPFPDTWKPFLANENDPIILVHPGERSCLDVPKLRPLFRQMQKSTWKG